MYLLLRALNSWTVAYPDQPKPIFPLWYILICLFYTMFYIMFSNVLCYVLWCSVKHIGQLPLYKWCYINKPGLWLDFVVLHIVVTVHTLVHLIYIWVSIKWLCCEIPLVRHIIRRNPADCTDSDAWDFNPNRTCLPFQRIQTQAGLSLCLYSTKPWSFNQA